MFARLMGLDTGFRNVRVMSAGISGWRDADLPIESERGGDPAAG